ncbi:hypothetical protein, partial [Streptomyces europaeiscabiei]
MHTSRPTLLTATAGTTAAVGGARREPRRQLFVIRVYGHSATAPDQTDIDVNLKEIAGLRPGRRREPLEPVGPPSGTSGESPPPAPKFPRTPEPRPGSGAPAH